MKLFLLLVLIFLVYYFYFRKRKNLIKQKNKPEVADLVLDEACQTYIRKEEALKIEIQGKTYYFCSKTCLQKFLEKLEGRY
ncbi:YHS domain-containing protein [Thermodesulfobacterium sp. TA1]|uniref:YHS domain-containing protein n=1 Tax=Thermodesulfobacterium sp. TA1 TaxID=2234087 RepID=UPI001232719B|nr:YHS domain-containing protein [Thermodesulfobacterium sp. TA1]QER42701.1 YHS domain-containing protein [Thermodesulfobacterium sp. TA1]